MCAIWPGASSPGCAALESLYGRVKQFQVYVSAPSNDSLANVMSSNAVYIQALEWETEIDGDHLCSRMSGIWHGNVVRVVSKSMITMYEVALHVLLWMLLWRDYVISCL